MLYYKQTKGEENPSFEGGTNPLPDDPRNSSQGGNHEEDAEGGKPVSHQRYGVTGFFRTSSRSSRAIEAATGSSRATRTP
jgi:hypothetical protein